MSDYSMILLQHRAKHCITQSELAEKLKVSRLSVINWENGEKPSRVNAQRILDLEREEK